MTIKKELEQLLKSRVTSGYRNEVVLDGFANEILKLIDRSRVKERLYRETIKRELKDKYEEDKYGVHCIACGAYGLLNDKSFYHYRRCPTAQLERILAL